MKRLAHAAVLACAGLVGWGQGVPVRAADGAQTAGTAAAADAIAFAERMGRDLHRHDAAAAIATDVAMANDDFRGETRVRGWITEERGDAIVVSFVDDTPAARYRVTVPAGGRPKPELEVLETPAALTPDEAGAAAARAVAVAAKIEACPGRYNSVVLPADTPGRWWVYLLPGTTTRTAIPLGGAYRFETDGATVLSRRGFTRSCIVLEDDPKGLGLMITHLMDPTPTEVHVFWSLWVGKPMFVGTSGGGLWRIEDGKIAAIRE